MKNTTTTNIADIGYAERAELIRLLQAWHRDGLPEDFSNHEVFPMMNRNSGYVFLTNDDFQCAMMNGDKLAIFHSTPYDGYEGFLEDLLDEYSPEDLHADDVEYLRNAAESEYVELPEAWQEKEEVE